MDGPVGPTAVGDTAIGRDGPTVARVMEIAPAGPIGVVRLAAMLEAGSVATSAVVSAVAVAIAPAEGSTVVVASMVEADPTAVDTANSVRRI